MIVEHRALKRRIKERRGDIMSEVSTIVTRNVILYLATPHLIVNNISLQSSDLYSNTVIDIDKIRMCMGCCYRKR